MKRLGIVVSHPIQYYSPMFRYLAKTIDLVVFYCHNPTEEEIGNEGFGLKFNWDVDLLSGYNYIFLKNTAKKPSLNSFFGCDTPEIGKAMKDQKISHVIIMGWYLKSYIQALYQARGSNIKTAVRGDSQLNPAENTIKRFLRKTIYHYFLSRYNKILYVGKRNKEYLLANGAKEAQLLFSPHAIDQNFWKIERSELKTKENKPTVFIWIGKFIEKKRPQDAILAFMKAYQLNPEMELWLVGAGKLKELCISLSEKHPAIKFLGFKNQKELKLILHNADALILTSDYRETWGLVVNECFSMGIPAIVSDACGSSEDLIDDGETGYCYKMGNLEDLKNRILQINIEMNKQERFISPIKQKNKIYSYLQNELAFALFMNSQ